MAAKKLPAEKRTSTRDRRFVPGTVERRAAADGRPSMLAGYAAVFGVETVIWGCFRERIEPGAFVDSIASDDVPAQFNHDPNYVLGRTANKTVRLAEDSQGLRYEVDLNEQDPDALRVGAKVARGDVRGSSFSFACEQDGDEEWVRDDPAKLPLRIIKRAKLYDVAPVTSPAYETTSVSARTAARAVDPFVAVFDKPPAGSPDLSEGPTSADGSPEPAAAVADAEEQAELVGYQALQTLLAQLTGLQRAATTIVGELIDDETETPTETADEEASEETVEDARLKVLQTLTGQMRAVLTGIDSVVADLQADDDADEAMGGNPNTLSADLDLMEY